MHFQCSIQFLSVLTGQLDKDFLAKTVERQKQLQTFVTTVRKCELLISSGAPDSLLKKQHRG